MLDVVNNKKQRKGNRRHNNNNRNKNRQRINNQNDGTSFDGDNSNNPINIISPFNRTTSKIYNKLRKNDAVKVIDTPSGRAGFVYQSSGSGSSSQSADFPMSPSIKESNSNWEDSYSQNQFVNRNANDVKLIPDNGGDANSNNNNNKKIMPVLTHDGKIALVVRGDSSRYFDENQNNGSGNSVSSKKYEPITNLTSIITALNSNNDNNINRKPNASVEVDPMLRSIQDENRFINRLDEFFASVTNKVKKIEEVVEHELGIDDEQVEDAEVPTSTTTTTTSFPFMESFADDDNNDDGASKQQKELLLVDKPLSEILGLPKRTHYHHPHDPLHTTSEVPMTRPTYTSSGRRTTINRPVTGNTLASTSTTESEEFDHESPEVINIAVIPAFDSEMEERLFGKSDGSDNSDRNLNEVSSGTSGAISSIHCAMQLMVAITCALTVFGVLGAYYKLQIVNQIRILYW